MTADQSAVPTSTSDPTPPVNANPGDNRTPEKTAPSVPTPHTPDHVPPTLDQAQQPQPEAQIELGDKFPVDRLTRLDEQLSRPKWVVPVRPRDDLEMLLRHSIKLCSEGN